VVDAVAELDAEIVAETARLRALNEAEEPLPLEELASMCERQIERNKFLLKHGVIPRELYLDAVHRHRRIIAMMGRSR
jgi:hypothetical protein